MTYNTSEAYELYMFYLAIKRHFTSTYDYFKYNGKVKANQKSFENRKDKFFFYKLSKKREARDIILSNMVADSNMWIGNLLDSKCEEIYLDWVKRQQSLTYIFKSDIQELEEEFNSNFTVEDGQHPRILRLYTMNRISIETLIILTDLTKCFPYWEKEINDTIVFPNISHTVKKYKPFLKYDKHKMKTILINSFHACDRESV